MITKMNLNSGSRIMSFDGTGTRRAFLQYIVWNIFMCGFSSIHKQRKALLREGRDTSQKVIGLHSIPCRWATFLSWCSISSFNVSCMVNSSTQTQFNGPRSSIYIFMLVSRNRNVIYVQRFALNIHNGRNMANRARRCWQNTFDDWCNDIWLSYGVEANRVRDTWQNYTDGNNGVGGKLNLFLETSKYNTRAGGKKIITLETHLAVIILEIWEKKELFSISFAWRSPYSYSLYNSQLSVLLNMVWRDEIQKVHCNILHSVSLRVFFSITFLRNVRNRSWLGFDVNEHSLFIRNQREWSWKQRANETARQHRVTIIQHSRIWNFWKRVLTVLVGSRDM